MRAITWGPERVADQLGAVLGLLARPTRLMVRTHPEDAAILEQALPTLREKYRNATHVEIAPDESLARGSCVATTGTGGAIDASIQDQLARIVQTLLPGPVPDGGAAAPQSEARP